MISKELFCKMVTNGDYLADLDKEMCGCKYVSHWYYQMMRGTFNPHINELDYELRNIKNPPALYEFIINKINDKNVRH